MSHLLLENVGGGCSFLDYLRKLVFLTWQWLVRVTSVTGKEASLLPSLQSYALDC